LRVFKNISTDLKKSKDRVDETGLFEIDEEKIGDLLPKAVNVKD